MPEVAQSHAIKMNMPAADRAARFLAEHLEDVLASLADGLVILDLDGRVVFVSPGAEDLTAVSASHASGRSASHAFAANPWIAETIARLDDSDILRTSESGDLGGPFGRRARVHMTVARIVDAAGAPAGTLVVFRDLGAQRSLAEATERGTRVQDLTAVAAGLAHEIKNPLGGIKGAAQLLGEAIEPTPDLLRYTALITREVDRVSALLEQLLELTRPPRLKLAAVNIHRVLNEVLLLERASGGERVTVRCNFDPSLPPVWGDEAKLQQVFLNVTKNALEAMDHVGTLTVSTRLETDFHLRNPGRDNAKLLSVEIEDTGPGIAPEACDRIFTPFFTTKASGTGLGLAISQRLVNEHGGLIRIESDPGRGTRVFVSLPTASGERED